MYSGVDGGSTGYPFYRNPTPHRGLSTVMRLVLQYIDRPECSDPLSYRGHLGVARSPLTEPRA